MNNVDLGKGNIFKLTLRLAIPAMLAQFVNVLYSIVDRIFVGNIAVIGDTALAGVGVTAPIVTLLSSVSFLFALGGAPLMAMKLGEGRKEDAQKILFNSFSVLSVVAILVTVVFFIVKRPVLMFFGASDNTIGYALDYINIYLFGAVFQILALGLNSFITCQGYAKTAMLTVLIGAIINIALDPVFIFVLNMGVKGAALATVLAQFASCAFVVGFLLSKKPQINLRKTKLDSRLIGRITANGLSPFVIISTDSLMIILMNIMLKRVGGASGDLYITVATIVMSFMQLVTSPMGGITLSCQPLVSFNYGSRNSKRIKQAILSCAAVCLIFTLIMTFVSQLLPMYFVRIFTSNPEVIELAVWGIRVFTAGIVILAAEYVFVDLLVALNRPFTALMLSMNRKILVMSTLILVLPIFMGYKGVFFAEPIADILTGIVSTIVFMTLLNKILKKRESAPEIY